MELAPRYCRTCGSRILVKNVCHNCNNNPLAGDNYCYDCGALTPNAEACVKCGARYKRSSPIKFILLLGSLLILAIAVAGYFISQKDKPEQILQQQIPTEDTTTTPQENTQQELKHTDTIVNNPVDTSVAINTPAVIKPDTSTIKILTPDSVKKSSPNVFTVEERKAYNARCSYFTKGQRSNVLFFVAGTSAFIKVDEKILELKRKSKGVDVATFSNGDYETVIRIDGLSGSAKEWLASCTLTIKNHTQNTSAKYKVYSSCIEL